ncbi:MAG: hypothetical protein R3B45_10830 [Bdellovibrionota bacterium]
MKFKKSREIHIFILAGFSFILSNCATNSDKTLLLDDNSMNDPLVINLKRSDFTTMSFISRYFKDEDWQATLAMNITYEPIIKIREKITKCLGYNSLKFLTAWESQGEAHITTITPVEYQECVE